MLEPNGAYRHAFWDGVQSHWGVWSIDTSGAAPFLVLQLQGAQPTVQMTVFGPRPVSWPQFEAWRIVAIEPEKITLQGAVMMRQSSTASAQPQPQPPPQLMRPDPPVGASEPGATSPLFYVPIENAHSAQVLDRWQIGNQKVYDAFKAFHDAKDDAGRQAALDASSAALAQNRESLANAEKQQQDDESAAQLDLMQKRSAAIHDGVGAFTKKVTKGA